MSHEFCTERQIKKAVLLRSSTYAPQGKQPARIHYVSARSGRVCIAAISKHGEAAAIFVLEQRIYADANRQDREDQLAQHAARDTQHAT